jgi:uncharacterized protein YndB with AHSA1/START domain
MKPSPNPVVRVTRRLPFPAERVFDAWLDPALAAKWLFATPKGKMVKAEVDPRVGGRFTFTDRRDGEDVLHTGEYLEIERPRRLVFTLGTPKYSPKFDRVTVEIVPKGSECELTLTHETDPEWLFRTQSGWTTILEGLAVNLGDQRAATNRQPGDYSTPGEVRLTRILPGPIERVWEYLTDPEKRRTWFASGNMDLRAGGKMQLQMQHKNLAPGETPPEKYQHVHDPGVSWEETITRCEPPRVLGFTWEEEPPAAPTEVIFELTPQGDDVQLVLTHRGFGANRDGLRNVSTGWHLHVAMLDARLSGNTPPPFWVTHERLEKEYQERSKAN